jgi:DNA-binding transcriptional ArsR family regulator
VSQHLKVLKDTGLVSEEVIGRRHVYRLDPIAVSALRDQLDTFWSRTLAGYEAAVGQTTKDQP